MLPDEVISHFGHWLMGSSNTIKVKASGFLLLNDYSILIRNDISKLMYSN